MEGKGVLVSTVKSYAFGIPQPKDRSLVFLAGNFDPTLDYDGSVAADATEAGTYNYITVQGVSKTVRPFDFVNLRPCAATLDPFKTGDDRTSKPTLHNRLQILIRDRLYKIPIFVEHMNLAAAVAHALTSIIERVLPAAARLRRTKFW